MKSLIGLPLRLVKNLIHQRNLLSYKLHGRKPWRLGYFDYKWKLIREVLDDSQIMQTFRDKNSLPEHFGERIDERIVEYPWIMANIPEKEGSMLDAGSACNFKTILLQKKIKNKDVTIVTLAPETNAFKDLAKYRYEDLRQLSFSENTFDIITSISTIEHVGMDNTKIYTSDTKFKEDRKDDYILAIKELRRILKPGGTALITVPYGKFGNFGFFQQFDKSMVERIVNAFDPTHYELTFYKYNDGWQISDEKESSSAEYTIAKDAKKSTILPAAAGAIACIKLIKPR